MNSTEEIITEHELEFILKQFMDKNQQYWIACDFSNQLLIYKSKLTPIMDLISMGLIWTNTFHIIEQKYNFLIALRIEKDKTTIKYIGNSKK